MEEGQVLTRTDAAVVEALAAQNARYAGSRARSRHLEALADGAEAVVTGQQVGLFLGPLFTTYKAATAVALARRLSAQRRRPVVPVFWLQTEDHDLAEIATCHVAPARGMSLRLELPADDNRISVAHRVLPEAVDSCLSEMYALLAHLPQAEGHVNRLRRHYRPGAGWGTAFAGTLAELFAEEGLVLLDPRDPLFAPLSVPVHRRAIQQARPIAEALKRHGEELAARGTPPTVHVRDASPLSFFHPDGPERARVRLIVSDQGLAELGRPRVHTGAEILEALDERPMCFSTSALLRPILQDTWLPTTAYVAGPAEAAYFAQLPPLYAAFGMRMPDIVPRVRVRLLEEKTRKALTHLRLTAEEACADEEQVLARVAALAGDQSTADIVSRRLTAAFGEAMEDVRPTLRAAGEGIDRAVDKTLASVKDSISRLAASYLRAAQLRERERLDVVRRLIDWLQPYGQPQERVYGISYFAAKHGERAFVERVIGAAADAGDGPVDLEL